MRFALLLISLCFSVFSTQAAPVHGLSLRGNLKYPEHFPYFNYINPSAPKKGTIRQASIGSFDTFNPFSVIGIPAAGVSLMHDSLLKQAADEPFSLYGLIAEKVEIDKNNNTVSFFINKDAKFSDNSPITAEDVAFSFNILREKGLPLYRYYYAGVATVTVISSQEVKFYLNENNPELALILGELPVLSKSYWEKRNFEDTTLEIPVTSGPYVIDSFKTGKQIVYKRNPTYWATDLNVNIGFYNFDYLIFDYYRDVAVSVEALRAGKADIRFENEAKRWVNIQEDDAVKNGTLKTVTFSHQLPSGMQAFVFNTRREIFQDRLVRKALNYMFDFEWTNKNLFYGLYDRTTSFFDNSYLKAPPLPDEAEKKLLNTVATDLPTEVFTTPFSLPDNNLMRKNFKYALDLFKQAGWTVQKGVLQKAGRPFTFEILLDTASAGTWERVVLPFVGNLKRIGITATIRTIDITQYKARLDNFDFDMTVHVFPQTLSPGNEQRSFWHSQTADIKGGSNYVGIKDKAVDYLVDKVITAPTQEELTTAVHALDRVLLWNYYVIPHWYSNKQRYIFWDKFDYPETVPLQGSSILTWWEK